MNTKRTIFLTGATGLVGSYLLKILLQDNYRVYVLARSKNSTNAKDRVKDVLAFWDKDLLKKINNLHIIDGDITEDNFGLNRNKVYSLKREIQEIYHCAAVTNYNCKLDELRKVNVLGTQKVLDFAMECRTGEGCNKVNYISTAYVCGNYGAEFSERDLNIGQRFNNAYEQSKFEAEELVNIYRTYGIWVDVFRPSIVVGESTTGKIPDFQQHLYQLLRIWSLGIFDYFPVKNHYVNIVPVDELCNGMVAISLNSARKNMNYHMFASQRLASDRLLNYFKKNIGLNSPEAIDVQQLSECNYSPAQKKILKDLFFTFNGKVKLDSSMTNKLLTGYGFTFSKIDEKLLLIIFKYLADTHYLKNNRFINVT